MRHLIIFVLVLLTIEIYGQKGPKLIDVYIVTNSNDTLYGKVKKRYANARAFITLPVDFPNDSSREFIPFEIKSFTIGENTFESLEFDDPPCTSCSNKVFIKKYIDGPMILYIYESIKLNYGGIIVGGVDTKCVSNYYIKKQQDAKAILAYRKPCDYENLVVITQPNNFEKFCNYFSDNPDIMKKIQEKEYTRKEIEAIVTEYNNCVIDK